MRKRAQDIDLEIYYRTLAELENGMINWIENYNEAKEYNNDEMAQGIYNNIISKIEEEGLSLAMVLELMGEV